MDAEQEHNNSEIQSENWSSSYSSEDEDGILLTDKVEQKILATVAKIRNKDPEIYNIKKPIFEEQDFEKQNKTKKAEKKNDKYTYKDLVTNKNKDQSENDEEDYKFDTPVVLYNTKVKIV